MEEPDYIRIVSEKLNLSQSQVKNVFRLIDDKNTVPFIARYRKELTQNLDEVKIREIIEIRRREQNLFLFKKSAVNQIDEQGKLTFELESKIKSAKTLKEVEDIYAPYKRKRKTKAQVAVERGFLPVAIQIKNQQSISVSKDLLSQFSYDKVIEGACDILIQEIVDDVEVKKDCRVYFSKYGVVLSSYKSLKSLEKLVDKVRRQKHKFEIYDNFSCDIAKIKGYQILALNRGESLGFLNVKIEKDLAPLESLREDFIESSVNVDILNQVLKKAYDRVFKSIEVEIRTDLTKRAERESIVVFEKNLKELLLRKPQYDNVILAIDPGFRTGCKIAVLDRKNNPVFFSKFFLDRVDDAVKVLGRVLQDYKIDFVVLGNGTGSNDCFNLIKKNFKCRVVIVDESGASVYSASKVGAQEFPSLDVTDRGTVSIGRRFVDPLAELVKIPTHSIGVGMYQHDINESLLTEKLGFVVEDVVNLVGVNVNTASYHVLKFISGLNLRSAKKIVENKPYVSREELKRVVSGKVFEQCAGFLRVPSSLNKFDNTNIHPEQYELADFIISNGLKQSDFVKFEKQAKKLYELASQQTFADILFAFSSIGEDVRKHSANLEIGETREILDLREGDVLDGVVRNIMPFGVFVDIGVKSSGLVHISELADKFVKNPADIVEVGQRVVVKVISLDLEKEKIGLSMRGV